MRFVDVEAEDRFWRKVKRTVDGCWEWQGQIHPRYGYGAYHPKKGVFYRAHRLAYTYANGPIIDGLFVCHRCDNRACCRPSHLFLGTHQENMDDMVRKGRSGTYDKRGEANPFSVLTEATVREILTSDERNAVIARRLGVSKSTISLVRRRVNWGHVSV